MLTVATLTHNKRTAWFKECKTSVDNNLPEGASHLVVQHTTDRIEVLIAKILQGNSILAFVDDDDTLCEGALETCARALYETGTGVAFTDELLVNSQGIALPYQSVRHRVKYNDCVSDPRAIHHLVVMRTECIPPSAIALGLKLGVGIEWLAKASAALCAGAVHVPMFGLNYRQHQGQVNRNTAWLAKFTNCKPQISSYLTTLCTDKPEYIPTYVRKP